MKRKLVSALVMSSLLLAACGDGERPDDGSGSIRIGVTISETGKFSVESGGLRHGYDLWAEKVNAAGGIDVGGQRRPVELIYYDDQSSPEAGAQLTERLITEDEVDFLFGSYGSGLTMATSAIAERSGVLNMSGGGASEEIFARGFKYVFGLLTPTSDYTSTTLEELQRRGARTVGIVHIDDAPMTSIAEGGSRKAQELGMQVVAMEAVPQESDYTAAMQRVASARPDVFVGAGAFQAAVGFARSAEQIAFRPQYMVLINGPADPAFITELGRSAERIIGPTQYHRTTTYSDQFWGSAEQFAQAFERRFGEEPSYIAATGAATAYTLQRAIEQTGTIETDAVRQALLDLQYESFVGPVDFANNGLNEKKPMPGVQIQNGRTVVVAPMPPGAPWQLLPYSDTPPA